VGVIRVSSKMGLYLRRDVIFWAIGAQWDRIGGSKLGGID